MYEMDFSSNNFTGEIPPPVGLWFTYIKVLNLSHNKLEGHIPSAFSNLMHIRHYKLKVLNRSINKAKTTK
ncbi:Receptor-like protein 9a [Linum grandiflorum]